MGEHQPSRKIIPAFFVDVVERGQEFKSGELPLHMTFFPPLQAPYTPEIAEALRYWLNPEDPFQATVGHEDWLGDGDIHVVRVRPSEQLMRIRSNLLHSIGLLPHDKTYAGKYMPHISIAEGDSRLQYGQTFEVGGISLIEKRSDTGLWKVMAKIGLKGARDETTS